MQHAQFFEFITRIADDAAEGTIVRLPPVLIQPMAADAVAKAVGRVAVGAPLNRTVEVAGPQQFRFDELIRQGLAARNDPREVVVDPTRGTSGPNSASARLFLPTTRNSERSASRSG